MNKEAIQDYIDDNVRKSTDSSIQALTSLVRSLQEDNRRHREEELESRQLYRMEMLNTVENIVKVTVNGKIDAANKKLDMLIERSEPVIKQFEEKQIVNKQFGLIGTTTGKFAAFIGSLTVIGAAFIWFGKILYQ